MEPKKPFHFSDLKEDLLSPPLEKRFRENLTDKYAAEFAAQPPKIPPLRFQYPYALPLGWREDFEGLIRYFYNESFATGHFKDIKWVEVQIHSVHTWQEKYKRPPEFTVLPAAVVRHKMGFIRLEYVWPDPIQPSTSLSINTIRLFVGEIFGGFLFRKVLKRLPTGEENLGLKPLGFFSAVSLCQFFQLENFSNISPSLALRIFAAGSKHPDGEMAVRTAREKYYTKVRSQLGGAEDKKAIEQAALKFLDSFGADTSKTLKAVVFGQLGALAKNLLIFTPQERIITDTWRQNQDVHFFRTLFEKVRLLLAELEIAADYFFPPTGAPPGSDNKDESPTKAGLNGRPAQTKPEETGNAPNLSTLVRLAYQLTSTGKAFAFLKHPCLLTEQEKKDFKIFPLKLHQEYFGEFATTLNHQKIQPKNLNLYLQNHFTKQPWQKIYNIVAAEIALQKGTIDEKQRSILLHELTVGKNWLKYRLAQIRELALVLEAMQSLWQGKNRAFLLPQHILGFQKAWKLFFGSAFLITKLNNLKSAKHFPMLKVEEFKAILYRHAEKEVKNYDSFLFAFLLTLFQALKEDWRPMLPILDPGLPMVEAWLFNPYPPEYHKPEKLKELVQRATQDLMSLYEPTM